MKKVHLFSLAIIVLCLLLVPAAGRALTIDFGVIAPTTGTISYAGGATALIGTNISVDNVVDTDSAAAYNLINGRLNFTTGNLAAWSNVPPVPYWNFGGGAGTTITITGTVDVNGNALVDGGDITGTLLTGYFGNATVTITGGLGRIAGAAFLDVKNDDLVTLFGGDPTQIPYWEGTFNLSFTALASGVPPNAFTSNPVLSGDVVNEPVPEPATMLLLGSGLLGMGVYARRRFKK